MYFQRLGIRLEFIYRSLHIQARALSIGPLFNTPLFIAIRFKKPREQVIAKLYPYLSLFLPVFFTMGLLEQLIQYSTTGLFFFYCMSIY